MWGRLEDESFEQGRSPDAGKKGGQGRVPWQGKWGVTFQVGRPGLWLFPRCSSSLDSAPALPHLTPGHGPHTSAGTRRHCPSGRRWAQLQET